MVNGSVGNSGIGKRRLEDASLKGVNKLAEDQERAEKQRKLMDMGKAFGMIVTRFSKLKVY